jgi:hypothetical protein
MKTERYFVAIVSVLLYVNLAAHFLANIQGEKGGRYDLGELVPSLHAAKLCKREEIVNVYEESGKLVGREKKETQTACP